MKKKNGTYVGTVNLTSHHNNVPVITSVSSLSTYYLLYVFGTRAANENKKEAKLLSSSSFSFKVI